MNSFADKEIELSDGQVRWHQILLLVKIADSCLWGLFYDYLRKDKWTVKDAFKSDSSIIVWQRMILANDKDIFHSNVSILKIIRLQTNQRHRKKKINALFIFVSRRKLA